MTKLLTTGFVDLDSKYKFVHDYLRIFMMSQYKKVVVVGATSGIGKALAERFVQNGSFVIVVGRRKERLAEFVQQYGHEKAQAVPFDITQLDSVEAFASNIMQTHDDVDCVVINSGIQRSIDFSQPETVDMKIVNEEFTTNYLSPLALTKAFLPYFKAKGSPASLVYTSSNLGLVPLPRCLNYCATKAALHHFLLSLRVQLKHTQIKIVEILPPAVQTELHDVKHQPDIKDGHKLGMPLVDFTDEAWEGLCSDAVHIPVGQARQAFDALEPIRESLFKRMQ